MKEKPTDGITENNKLTNTEANKKPPKDTIGRTWLLTIFEEKLPQEAFFSFFYEIGNDTRLRYACAGLEECPETHKLHYHLVLNYSQSMRFSSIKEEFEAFVPHIEQKSKHSSLQECIDYAIQGEEKYKDEKYPNLQKWELGKKPFARGKEEKADFGEQAENLLNDICSGESAYILMQKFPALFLRYAGNIIRMQNIFGEVADIKNIIQPRGEKPF